MGWGWRLRAGGTRFSLHSLLVSLDFFFFLASALLKFILQMNSTEEEKIQALEPGMSKLESLFVT